MKTDGVKVKPDKEIILHVPMAVLLFDLLSEQQFRLVLARVCLFYFGVS